MRRSSAFLAAFLVAAAPASAQGQTDAPSPPPALSQELKRLTIEELSELDVTSVSRRVERLSETAAAISVVRADDIRRSGVLHLAEAMRLADGLDVARYDGRTWNVTARGFNMVTANKLLVMMDGRTLYSPLFSGTFWDVQDTVMSDIDRIEVIRGPGGAIWGANAVNGVINIITRPASDTLGGAAVVSAGSENQLVTSARYGAAVGDNAHYRVYAKYRKQGANLFADGTSADDALQIGQLGMRMDSNADAASRWSLQGNAYIGSESLVDRADTDVGGGYAQGLWAHRFSPTAEMQVRANYDYTYRKVPLQFEEGRHTVEVDGQHHRTYGTRHDVVVGGQVRVSSARAIGAGTFTFEPEQRTNAVGGVFAQDEISLAKHVFLTVGSKFEGNDYTGLELSPTARVRWTPRASQTVWGAVSRAVRLPTRFDTDLVIRSADPVVVLTGNPSFDSESVVAYEAGYRIRAHDRLAIDLSTFVNNYDDLRSQEIVTLSPPVVELGNTLNALTNGVEVAVTAQPADRWRVHSSYSYLHKDASADPGSRDVTRGGTEGNDPSHLFSLRSYLDLPRGLALDGTFRYVGGRPLPEVPGYASLDLRLGWLVKSRVELSLVGQNLLDSSHSEFGTPGPRRYEFERGLYVRSAWRF